MMLINDKQFAGLFRNNPSPEEWVQAINEVCPGGGIDTPLRLAAFLAQCGHESAGFTRLVENTNYSVDGLLATFPRYFTPQQAAEYARQPERIANRVYANRLGNGPEESGDGWRWRGRGPLQITGRANRERLAHDLGLTIGESEVYLLTPAGGIASACWFWRTHGLNQYADSGYMGSLTKRINGGANGLAERMEKYQQALKILEAV